MKLLGNTCRAVTAYAAQGQDFIMVSRLTLGCLTLGRLTLGCLTLGCLTLGCLTLGRLARVSHSGASGDRGRQVVRQSGNIVPRHED